MGRKLSGLDVEGNKTVYGWMDGWMEEKQKAQYGASMDLSLFDCVDRCFSSCRSLCGLNGNLDHSSASGIRLSRLD